MKIDRTKFTAQYENGAIKTMWVSIEVSMDSGMGEDPKAALDLSKKISDEWYQQQGGWIYNANLGTSINDVPIVTKVDPDEDIEIARQLEKAKIDLATIEFQEDALQYMNNNGWTFNVELKNIANSKPKRP